jgi:hypothetical protein
MRAHQLLAFVGISLLALSTGCSKEGKVSPAAEVTAGRLVKMPLTSDASGQNTRPRGIVDMAPVKLEGYQGMQLDTGSFPLLGAALGLGPAGSEAPGTGRADQGGQQVEHPLLGDGERARAAVEEAARA